jgi:hypothetical protein
MGFLRTIPFFQFADITATNEKFNEKFKVHITHTSHIIAFAPNDDHHDTSDIGAGYWQQQRTVFSLCRRLLLTG